MRCPVCGNEKGERHVCASCGTALYDEVRSPFVQEEFSPKPYIIFIWPGPLGTTTLEMTKGQFIVSSALVLGPWILSVYLLLSFIILESTSGWREVALAVAILAPTPAIWFFFWASGRGEVVERQRKEKCFGPPSEKRP